jgi:hypothetical protein
MAEGPFILKVREAYKTGGAEAAVAKAKELAKLNKLHPTDAGQLLRYTKENIIGKPITDSTKRARLHRALDAVMDARVGRAKDAGEFKPGDKVTTDVTPQVGSVLEVQGSGDMAKVLVRFGTDKYGVSDVRKLYAYLLCKA